MTLDYISFHMSPAHPRTPRKGWQTMALGKAKPAKWQLATGSSQVAQRLLNFQVQQGSSFRRSSWKLDMKMKGAQGWGFSFQECGGAKRGVQLKWRTERGSNAAASGTSSSCHVLQQNKTRPDSLTNLQCPQEN